MLDSMIDPDPETTNPQWETAQSRLNRLAATVAKLSGHACTADIDGDDDCLTVSFSFHGLTLADVESEVSERIADLYAAEQRAGGSK